MNFQTLLEFIKCCGGDSRRLIHLREEIQCARNVHGDSLLHIVSAEADEKLVQLLLEMGCNPNCQNRFGSPPIDVAAWKESKPVVEALLNAGADINLEDSTGATVLDNLRSLGKGAMASWIQSRVTKMRNDTGASKG